MIVIEFFERDMQPRNLPPFATGSGSIRHDLRSDEMVNAVFDAWLSRRAAGIFYPGITRPFQPSYTAIAPAYSGRTANIGPAAAKERIEAAKQRRYPPA